VINAATTTHKTRAQRVRDMVEVRLAVNAAGPQIAEILKANGIELDTKWDDVFPHWLIACVDDLVFGCCQVVFSKPVGYVEFLAVHPDAPFKLKAIGLRKLMYQSMNSLYAYGAQYVGGVVAEDNKKFAPIIEKMGFVKTYPADMFVKRLR
jgi:hypothetical protein